MTSSAPLPHCTVSELAVVELAIADEHRLQQFFADNPEYFMAVLGAPAIADEARNELTEPLPDGWAFTKQWRLGWQSADGTLAAIANITSDLLAPGVWHIGLFILATARHGTGDAPRLFADIEAWAKRNGAQWLRLGVVAGNTRAERFWNRQGFSEVRRREVEMGHRINTIRVMVKPLGSETLPQYLQYMERDRPDHA
jgi:GNAT superfamily N-acetyltransferase